MKKILFENVVMKGLLDSFDKNRDKKIMNFLNQHDIYQFSKESLFQNSLKGKENINFIDGFIVSKYLTLTNFKRVSRTTGPNTTRNIISNPKLSGNKKHFFIGFEDDDLKELNKKFPHLKDTAAYNPPYIKTLKFSKKEISKIAEKINLFKADIVWIGVGSPKQNILANALFPLVKSQYLVNIGAALDFLLGKKEEAPEIVRKFGIEWLYRLITDFKYTKKKVWRSLIGIISLPKYVGLK